MKVINEINRIIELLSKWITEIELYNSSNNYDINKYSESFCIPFLNEIFNLNLKNLNRIKYNYPAIDLGDEKNGIAFQITSRDDSTKIYENITDFIKNHDIKKYPNKLIFFLLNKNKPTIKSDKIPHDLKYEIINYGNILKELQEIYYKDKYKFDRIKELLEQEFGSDNKINKNELFTSLPPRPIELFGRNDEYKIILNFMKKDNSMFLINSMGGVGKTELCKKYYWDNYKNYKFSGWINYLNGIKESFVEQFNDEIIEKNENDNYNERFKKIVSFLTKNNKDILLIIDNIDKTEEQDNDLQIIRSLPISIIVTSRIKLDMFQDKYEINFLDKEACVNLFYEHYNLENNDIYLNKIIELAGFHTLAIELLSKTCKASNLKIKEFYDKLISTGFNLNDVIKEKVSTSWHDETNNKKFFEHILKVFEISNLNHNEKYFLTNISVLPSIPIKKDYLKEWLQINSFDEINSLIKKGWINEIGFEIKMHNIIREAVIFQTKPDFGTCYILILYFINKFKEKPEEDPLTKKEFISYAESILNNINENEEMIAMLYNNLAFVYQTFGYLEKAKNLQKKSIEIIKKCPIILDENSKATSYNNLASIYKALNNLEKAKEYQLIALQIRERILDKNHPDLATSYNNLSGIFHNLSIQNNNLSDLKNALDFQLKALSIREQFPNKNHPDLANSYNNLAQIYVDMKNLNEACKFQKKAVEIGEKVFNKNHNLLATLYNNFASILFLQEYIKEALCYQLKATRIRKRIFYKNHYLVGISYDNLARIYLNLKNFKMALYYCEKAIDILKFNFPNGHPDINMALNNLKIINDAKDKKNGDIK